MATRHDSELFWSVYGHAEPSAGAGDVASHMFPPVYLLLCARWTGTEAAVEQQLDTGEWENGASFID